MRASLTTFLAAAGCVLAAASTASADSTDSSNWAGYAVHRSGVRFTRVIGTWRQPKASCQRGKWTYSSTWVGLGGYRESSTALEQVGTEVDCSPSGRAISTAWYELVPAATQTIQLRVSSGDAVDASVTVIGNRVSVTLKNLTTHHSFSKALHDAAADVSSADWIEESPSECTGVFACQILPLANFRTVRFGLAQARSTSGQVGTISDSTWRWTRIRLLPGGQPYVAYRGQGVPAGAATPSPLSAGGSAFSIKFSEVALQSNPFLAREARGPGYLVHEPRR